MHEILIGIVILAIVGAQGYVAYTTWKKIDFYKEIIPQSTSFETVKVYIRESQIKDIKAEYILSNLKKFKAPKATASEPEATIILSEPAKEVVMDAPIDSLPVQSVITWPEETLPGYEDLIWIAKDNEEKKIKYKLLRSYEQAGWSKI